MKLRFCEYAVLLDCQVFDAVKLDFSNANLRHLADLAISGQVKILVTSIILEEIKSHISSEARRIADQLKAAANHAVCRAQDIKLVGTILDEEIAEKFRSAGFAELNRYLELAKIEVIPVDQVAVTEVLADYFASRPPFGAGRKKSEFPDAFTMHAVRTWAKQKGFEIVVVSGDGDLKAYCQANPQFRLFESLASFLAIFPDAEVSNSIALWMEDHWNVVEDYITEDVQEFSFELRGTEGSVEAVRVVSMQVIDSAVVEITKEIARISADIEVELEADIYAFVPTWSHFREAHIQSQQSGSIIDYLELGVDIIIALHTEVVRPSEIKEVVIVDRPVWPRLQVPDDWDPNM